MSTLGILEGFRRFASQGRAAGSAEVTARTVALSRWYRLPWYSRMLILIAAVAGGTMAGALAGYPIGASALVSAGIVFATAGLLLAPQLGMTLGVIVLSVPLLLPLGILYTTPGQPPYGDAVAGSVSLLVTLGISVWVAAKWSRGRVWVTVALCTVALISIGPVLLYTFPALGLNAARLSVVIVLLLRCGGAAWIIGALGLIWAKRHRSHLDEADGYAAADPADVSSAWRRRAAVEKETAEILASLPKPYRVFHDVNVPGSDHGRIGHLVVGPTGVTALASVHALGPVRDDRREGVVIPGVDLSECVNVLLSSKRAIAKALRVHPRDVALAIVVQGREACMESSLRVAVHYAGAPGRAVETIRLIDAQSLVSEVATPFAVWSVIKTQQTIRRAQMKLRPAVMPLAAPNGTEQIRMARVDQDGKIVDLAGGQSSATPGLLGYGSVVDVSTSLGPIKGLRIVRGPTIDRSGQQVFYVCSEEDYLESSLTGKKPTGHAFPVGSIRPVEAHS